jgi:O-antigen ligase
MATGSLASYPLGALILAGTLIGAPWVMGGRSPAGQAVIVLMTVLAVAAHLATPGPALRLRPLPFLAPAGILALLSAWQTLHPDRTLQTLSLHAAYLLAGLLAWHLARTVPGAGPLLRGSLALSGALLTVGGLARLWLGTEGGYYASALIGPFGYPNAMAGFLLIAAAGGFAELRSGGMGSRAASALAAIGAVSGIALTRSRGAVLAAGMGFVVWAWLERERWWRRPAWLLVGVLPVLVWAFLNAGRLGGLGTALGWTGGGPADTSVLWRTSMLAWTWDMIRDHAWLGVGPGAYPVAFTHYQRLPYVAGENPHNLVVEIAAEYGIPAAALFVLAAAAFFWRGSRSVRALPSGSPSRHQAAVLMAGLVSWLLHAAIDMDAGYPAIALAAAVLAGLAGQTVPAIRSRRFAPTRSLRLAGALALALLAAVALGRYTAASLVARGQADLEDGEATAALDRFSWAARVNPLSFAAVRGLARAAARAGDADRALAFAERGVRLAPADPNGHFLLGDVAFSANRVEVARRALRQAVDRAPAAQLRLHARLMEAMAESPEEAGEALRTYERALSLFTPERVLHSEARCLAPGDRYLLARMSRLAAPRYARLGDGRAEVAQAQAEALAHPDARPICGRGGPPGRTSPEAAVAGLWNVWHGGRPTADAEPVRPAEPRHHRAAATLGLGGPAGWHRGRLAWVLGLAGTERRLVLAYAVELVGEDGVTERCARNRVGWTPQGWQVEDRPRLAVVPCPR